MWCRLITDGENSGAQALPWRFAGRAPKASSSAPPQPLYNDPVNSMEFQESLRLDQIEGRMTEAYQKGRQDGEAAANERMASQVNAKLEQLARSIEQVSLHRGRIQREAEPELVKLSLAIARRILRRELTIDPDALLGLLKAGLEKIESSETHRVRVHPEHAASLTRLLEGSARPLTVTADPGLPVGAVVFETTRGALDTGLETQLREIERGFADIYPK